MHLPIVRLDGGGERPDFVVHGDTGSIGVELTDLYVASSEYSWQRQAPRRAEALKRAQAHFAAASGPSFDFHFDFNPLPPDITVDEVAQQACAAAFAALEGPGEVTPNHLLEATPLVRWLYRSPKLYHDPRWSDQPCHSVPVLDPVNVQSVVDRKGAKLQHYRHCDQQWLVIGVDFWDPGQDQELTWPAGILLHRRGFDRIFIVKPMFQEYVEPPTAG